MEENKPKLTLQPENLYPLLDRLKETYAKQEKSAYADAMLGEIEIFRQQLKVVEEAFSAQASQRFAAQCASLVLKTSLPKLRKFKEFEDDEEAHFFVKIEQDYIYYLEQYCKNTYEPSGIPENICTLLALGALVLVLAFALYQRRGHPSE